MTTISCVILTMGDRPDELAQAIDSVRAQCLPVEVVIVANGVTDIDVPRDVRVVAQMTNIGIPAGRNVGLAASSGEFVYFLDDDAVLVDSDCLSRMLDRFHNEPRLAVITCRIVDELDSTQRRHVPRILVRDARRSSRVTTFLGGASMVRRASFESAGGFPDEFFYGHEETSLAWRMLDAGATIYYDAEAVVRHPRTSPSRHSHGRELSARNRVLLARRHLPSVLGLLYVLVWLSLSVVRDPRGWRSHLRGVRKGLVFEPVPRQPMRWSTVWRMTKLGRPPII